MHAPAAASRIVDLNRTGLVDPAEPWELPGTAEDLATYSSMRRAAYAFLPADLGSPELPAGAVHALDLSVGPLSPGSVILLPRTPRSTGPKDWVVTPACVLGLGADALAMWVGDPVGGILVRMPYADIAAIVDLTVLLFGRLEIVGPGGSIVLRYNTVGRTEIRAALLAIRRSWVTPGSLPVREAGPRPEALPHKWMAMLRSADMLPSGPEPRVTAAGAMSGQRASRRNGVATLTSGELLVVTEPDTDGGVGAWGTDLVAMPRAAVSSLAGANDRLEVGVSAGLHRLTLRIPAHPSLVMATTTAIAPLVR